MIKTVLITGGAGFIGSHVSEKLMNNGYKIIILQRSLAKLDKVSQSKGIKFYDLNEPISNIFRDNKIDCVIHLATYYKKDHAVSDIQHMLETNLTFPTLILEEMVANNVKYFINTGTFFEFALGEKKNLSEDSKKEPYNLYAATKAAFEEVVKYYSHKNNIKTIDLKLFAPYGPKDNEKLVVLLIKHLLANKPLEISKGGQRWNWTYVKDVAEAYLKALKYITVMKNNYESFNIGSNKAVSIKEIVRILEKISKRKNIIRCAKPYRNDEIMYVNCNNKKAKRYLKWAPAYTAQQGLSETYKYYAGR